jgi:putative glutamine amidotransferase
MQAKIGITTWLRPLPTYLGKETLLYTLGYEYVERVKAAGGLPLLLPHLSDVEDVLDLLDGLVLSGGGDLHPESYGAVHDGTSSGVSLEADRWEIALVKAARQRRMPMLGICRGMQIMAVAAGGHLSQHISGVEGHPDMDQMQAEEILTGRHAVTLAPACTLAAVYGQKEIQVNTIHHQAVTDAGGFKVVGYDGSGEVIEALEAGDGWSALGVQWHPEKLPGQQEDRLFAHLLREARTYAGQRTRPA